MTSSLVGSEMCIRDSDNRIQTLPRLHASPCPVGILRRGGPPAVPRSSPVSYTHLTLPTICSV
eukprot:10379315-Prorocentrum_lima.AAC.1